MSNDFKPSTKELFKLLRWYDRHSFRDENDEVYRIYEVCIELSNRAYKEHSEEIYKHGTWTAEQDLVDALREALVDHPTDYAVHFLAYTLLKYGCRRPETLAQLHPWHRLMFRWHEEGHTASHVSQILQEAGIVEQWTPESIETINSWIQNPALILHDHISIIYELFGLRVVYASLRDIGFEPRHDELFRDLAQSASPPICLNSISQGIEKEERFKDVSATTELSMRNPDGTTTQFLISDQRAEGIGVFSDQGSHWVVQYMLNGETYQFRADCRGTWMDVEAVINHFNQLMDRIDRREQAFRFGTGYHENEEYGFFIVADRDRFPELAGRLYIPLHLPY
jgi:hypothetical protein